MIDREIEEAISENEEILHQMESESMDRSLHQSKNCRQPLE
jgi:hypothetical protein